jgi:Nif-specific regulatory protein
MKTSDTREGKKGKMDILVSNFERDLITDALKDSRGNQAQAARILGTTKRIIQYKIKKYGIDPSRFQGTRQEADE